MCSNSDELWSFADSKANARCVWSALCRQTRRVVAYFVEDRSADAAHTLRERSPPAYRCRATRSDFRLAYDEVFPRRIQRPCDKGDGETCYVERWNCTLRQRLGRFVRTTLSFPSATGCTHWPCVCSSIITICPLTNYHYLQL